MINYLFITLDRIAHCILCLRQWLNEIIRLTIIRLTIIRLNWYLVEAVSTLVIMNNKNTRKQLLTVNNNKIHNYTWCNLNTENSINALLYRSYANLMFALIIIHICIMG